MSMIGKVVLVAGGGRDIGKACALEFAKQGANVVITYLASGTSAEQTSAEIESCGVKALAIQADLSQAEQVNKVVNQTIDEFGQIDHLVHVAGGLLERVKVSDMSSEHWHKVMDVNMTSLFLMCKACIPHFSKGSTIVTFASQAGCDGGGPGAVAYATSKGAIMAFNRGLAKEIGPDIRVNSVCPGMINTGFHDTFTADNVRTNVASATCAKREGNSEEVANLVYFLASEKASYMTGNNVDINGGLVFS